MYDFKLVKTWRTYWVLMDSLGARMLDADFSGIKTGDVDDSYNWMADPVVVEFVDEYLDKGQLSRCVLEAARVPAATPALRLLRNYPNPFSASTLLVLQSSEAQAVTLEIVSAEGTIVYRDARQLPAGINEWRLNSTAWGRKGAFFARIRYEGGWLRHTLIVE